MISECSLPACDKETPGNWSIDLLFNDHLKLLVPSLSAVLLQTILIKPFFWPEIVMVIFDLGISKMGGGGIFGNGTLGKGLKNGSLKMGAGGGIVGNWTLGKGFLKISEDNDGSGISRLSGSTADEVVANARNRPTFSEQFVAESLSFLQNLFLIL